MASPETTEFNPLLLENQLCFPLYAASKEIIRAYKPHLDKLDLTYTQYIVMLVLWETPEITAHALGGRLLLDSGTLTPLLKKLETKGYITRHRSKDDERNLVIALTDKGSDLRKQAIVIPQAMGSCVHLEPEEALQLYRLLYKVLAGLEEQA